MRYYEIIAEGIAGVTAQEKQRRSREKANQQIQAASSSVNDALRRCQDKQRKAQADGDPQKSRDATDQFYRAKKAADTKRSNARAKLNSG